VQEVRVIRLLLAEHLYLTLEVEAVGVELLMEQVHLVVLVGGGAGATITSGNGPSGTSGTVNTGGGGGGGGFTDAVPGGNGGSGIVIIKYTI
jgi:hypothetical protein